MRNHFIEPTDVKFATEANNSLLWPQTTTTLKSPVPGGRYSSLCLRAEDPLKGTDDYVICERSQESANEHIKLPNTFDLR